MVPFYIMVAGILLARGVGAFAWPVLDSWTMATRVGLAIMFLFTGAAHFNKTRDDLVQMVPPGLPSPALLVTLTGIAEIIGAIGLLIPTTARFSALALVVLLVALFPANIHAARIDHTIGGRPHTPMIIRAPLQVLWIALLWWSVNFVV